MYFFKLLAQLYEKYVLKLTGVAFLILTLIISYQVIGRKFFNITIPGYDQIVIWISIICIYLMLGLSLVEGRHLRVSVFVKRLSELKRVIVELIGTLVSISYVVIALFATISFMFKSKAVGSKAIMFHFPTWVVYLFISIGFLLFLICYLERIIRFTKYFKNNDKKIIDILKEDG